MFLPVHAGRQARKFLKGLGKFAAVFISDTGCDFHNASFPFNKQARGLTDAVFLHVLEYGLAVHFFKAPFQRRRSQTAAL